jgi:predicted kinase
MKKFLQKVQEDQQTKNPVVMAFGRMNPPTVGHEKLVNRVKEIARDYKAPHHVIISHSVDANKNPLDAKTKLKHAKRFFPNTNIEVSSKEMPTFLQHAARLNAAGHDHLVMVAGSDRIPEYEKKLHDYNGTKDKNPKALFNFKKIELKSAGQRDPDSEGVEGMSASKMREHATNNDFHSFKKGVPEHLPEKHARELFRDVRKGMGIHEDVNHGLFKALFICGGPGSGKDIIIREAVSEKTATEMNPTLAINILNDKHKLHEQSKDFRREAIRNRKPLIINGTTNEQFNIVEIKNELEELGYETMMIFVNTTNDSSKKRNEGREKMMAESVRQERWEIAQKITEDFNSRFNKYLEFDNSLDLKEANDFEIAQKEEDIAIIHEMSNWFFDIPIQNEIVDKWMFKNNKGMIVDRLFEQVVNRTQNTPMTAYGKRNREGMVQREIQNLRKKKQQQNADIQKSIETLRNRLRFEEKDDVQDASQTIHAEGADCSCGDKTAPTGRTDKKSGTYKRFKLVDNICPACQLTAKAGRADSVTDGDIASNTKYTFRTYHEETSPSIEVKPEPKETRFQQDNDKIKAKKQKTSPAEAGKVIKPAGVSPEYDTRGSGTVYPMSGLGNVTYREQTENKYGSTTEVTRKSFSKFRKESIDSPSVDMGVTGGYHGPSNKEPPESMLDKTVNMVSNKKKKK